MIDLYRFLYNSILEENIQSWERSGSFIHLRKQLKLISNLASYISEYKQLHPAILESALIELNYDFVRNYVDYFDFRRTKFLAGVGIKPAILPTPKSRSNHFCYLREEGWRLGEKLTLDGIGEIVIKNYSEPMPQIIQLKALLVRASMMGRWGARVYYGLNSEPGQSTDIRTGLFQN